MEGCFHCWQRHIIQQILGVGLFSKRAYNRRHLKFRLPDNQPVTCRGPRASPVQKRPREWAAAAAQQTFSGGGRSAGTKRPSPWGRESRAGRTPARAPPPPARAPPHTPLPLLPGQVRPRKPGPRPSTAARQVPTAPAQVRGPPLPMRSFIHLPAPGGGGNGRESPRPRPRQGFVGLKAGTPGQALTLGVR